MRASLSLGRIAGIEIGVNWSLAIAFFLFTASLAGEIFPSDVPGYSSTAYILAGIAGVLLFYASLLAHELGHAIMARRLGTRVDGITLWLFGGVARLSGNAVSGNAELAITLIGPAITVVVGIAFALLSALLGTLNIFPLTADVFAWLARINLVLAVFNLIPAFPLDGGRVLRALIWRFTHNQSRATAIAAGLGRAFGVLMIVGGLGLVFLQQFTLINGLWFAVLGWFLFSAAGSEELQTRLQRSLAGVRVRDVMAPDPVTAPDWITVEDFIARFAMLHHALAYPLRSFDGQLSGLLTLQDLSRVGPQARASTQVRDVAHGLAGIPTVGPDDPLVDLLQSLDHPDAAYALVMDAGLLVGLITPAEVRRAIELGRLDGRRQPAGLSPTN